jgi:hypothetical protein
MVFIKFSPTMADTLSQRTKLTSGMFVTGRRVAALNVRRHAIEFSSLKTEELARFCFGTAVA